MKHSFLTVTLFYALIVLGSCAAPNEYSTYEPEYGDKPYAWQWNWDWWNAKASPEETQAPATSETNDDAPPRGRS